MPWFISAAVEGSASDLAARLTKCSGWSRVSRCKNLGVAFGGVWSDVDRQSARRFESRIRLVCVRACLPYLFYRSDGS